MTLASTTLSQRADDVLWAHDLHRGQQWRLIFDQINLTILQEISAEVVEKEQLASDR